MTYFIDVMCKREDLPPELVKEIDIPGLRVFESRIYAPTDGAAAFLFSVTPWTDLPYQLWHVFPDDMPTSGIYLIHTRPDDNGDRRLTLIKFKDEEDAERSVRLSGMERFGFKRIMMEKQRECQDEEDGE